MTPDPLACHALPPEETLGLFRSPLALMSNQRVFPKVCFWMGTGTVFVT
jgi:hypothetical protein